ncbi:CAP domain-containing protein [Nocardia brasiliensis]|uniref:CAP domain-containing protein n=1 Tax=Nocardia brasiliensis TaxID=37326 RepID=UPI0024542495|nr:CAP domain-containing protein [Nocardia brasiliensis]
MLSLSTAVGASAIAVAALAGAPAAQAAPSAESPADAVISLTNDERAKAGCPALRAESHLTQAAQGHSEDMAAGNFMDHNSSKGDPGARIRAAGYKPQTWAENIAAGYQSADDVVDGWMNSPGHRANILNCGLRDIGVGYAKARNGTPYWTQNFGTSSQPDSGKPTDGKPGKPTDGQPGKPDKPGQPDKPDKPGQPGQPGGGDPSDGDCANPSDGGSPWDPWGDWSDGGGDSWDPWGDGSDGGGDSWDPWGESSDGAGESWDPWGNSAWDPWGSDDAAESSWDPWSNGFDAPIRNVFEQLAARTSQR